MIEDEKSVNDSDGDPGPRVGAGVTPSYRPLTVTLGGKPKPFDDGQGLRSPGRWPPEHRVADKSGGQRPGLHSP